jgi:quinol monooxygenase YgiN
MSVLVIVKIKADKAAFEKLVAERGDKMREISSRGMAAGARHHRFGMGYDGTVVIVDEWNNAEAFQQFFSDPEIGAIMQDSGVQGAPEVLIVEALETPDQF